MKCDACGAPVENGKCTYCGKSFAKPINVTVQTPYSGSISGASANNSNNSNTGKKKKKLTFGRILLWLIFFPIMLTLAIWNSNWKPGVKLIVIILLWGFFFVYATVSEEQEATPNWATEDPDISSFEYYIDGDTVHLEDYKGSADNIRIPLSFTIDGVEYKTDTTLGALFALGSVHSVIIPEGITNVASNIFNSCGLKFVYIPSTLKAGNDYEFYDYFTDVDTIYYGGTEEQWKQLTNNEDRSDIGAVQILYNVKESDLYNEE